MLLPLPGQNSIMLKWLWLCGSSFLRPSLPSPNFTSKLTFLSPICCLPHIANISLQILPSPFNRFLLMYINMNLLYIWLFNFVWMYPNRQDTTLPFWNSHPFPVCDFSHCLAAKHRCPRCWYRQLCWTVRSCSSMMVSHCWHHRCCVFQWWCWQGN